MKFLLSTLPALLPFFLGFAMSAPAQAAETDSVIVLQIAAQNVDPNLARRVAQTVQRVAAQTPGFAVRPGKSLEEIQLVFGCTELNTACLTRVGQSLRSRKVITGSIARSRNVHTVRLSLFDVARQRFDMEVADAVTPLSSLEPTVSRLTERLLGRSFGSAEITLKQSGVELFLDEEPQGVTEGPTVTIKQVRAGPHQLQARKPGFLPWSQTITVFPDKPTAVTIDLASNYVTDSSETVAAASSGNGWKTAFWTTTAATLAFAGISIGFLVAESSLTGDKEDEIMKIHEEHPEWEEDPNLGNLFNPESDACRAAARDPQSRAQGIEDICSDASLFSGLAIGFGIAAGVSAITSGVLFYKAYLAEESAGPTEPPKSDEIAWTIRPLVARGSGGVGLILTY